MWPSTLKERGGRLANVKHLIGGKEENGKKHTICGT